GGDRPSWSWARGTEAVRRRHRGGEPSPTGGGRSNPARAGRRICIQHSAVPPPVAATQRTVQPRRGNHPRPLRRIGREALMMSVTPLLVPITLLLAVGGVVGHSDDLVRRLPGFDRELAKTVTMRLSLACATVATIALAAAAIWHLVGCTSIPTECAQPQPDLLVPLAGPIDGLDFGLTVRLDGLAALFLLIVAVCGGCIAVYSFGWLAHNPLRHSVAGSFCLFLFATAATVLVNNAFWLLVALELMTLSSADLVRYAGRTGGAVTESRTAVRTYLLMSHAGLVCLMAGLLPILVVHGELDLKVLGNQGGSPAPVLSFGLVLLGLAVRAGITPFHSWVPAVHPQLPTNTHAVMSAVMLKIPIYLMIRFFFEGIIGPITWWWGAVLLI